MLGHKGSKETEDCKANLDHKDNLEKVQLQALKDLKVHQEKMVNLDQRDLQEKMDNLEETAR